MLRDFDVPEHFAAFSPEKGGRRRVDEGRETWHMLSLGGVGAGLPWHTHGETWIAVVHGRKAWFVYEHGRAGSAERGHPMDDAVEWYNRTFMHLPLAQRPLHCLQQPGDIVYVPGGWAHLTVNLDETIGAGNFSLF
jgi:hypothetical protein